MVAVVRCQPPAQGHADSGVTRAGVAVAIPARPDSAPRPDRHRTMVRVTTDSRTREPLTVMTSTSLRPKMEPPSVPRLSYSPRSWRGAWVALRAAISDGRLIYLRTEL